MKCPNCGRDLVEIGRIATQDNVKPGQPFDAHPSIITYACTNSRCELTNKGLSYDVKNDKLSIDEEQT